MSVTTSEQSPQKKRLADPAAWDFVRQMAVYARPYWIKSALCGVSVVVRVGFMLAMPLFYREIFDGVLARGDDQLLVRLLVSMGVAFGVVVLADLAQAYLASDLAARIMGDVRRRMYRHLQRLSEGFYARTQIGDLMSRFTNDLFSVEWAVSASLMQRVNALLDEQTEEAEIEGSDGLPPFSEAIRFEGIGFSYTGAERNLDGLSFTILAGESVAFVGRGGCREGGVAQKPGGRTFLSLRRQRDPPDHQRGRGCG